ncbi:MAG: SipW-dependent-type signal peptide-containing protein [Gracilibacteraceae bacterium]|nr:SipW-dependent-type signal peptide-containing protein [Gracilibacteraceae bacterium]
MTRKFTLVLCAAVLCAMIAVGGTLAYFTSSLTAPGTVTMGTVQFEFLNLSLGVEPQAVHVRPGESLPQQSVSVLNTGDEPIYVRVQIEKYWRDAGGNPAPGSADYIEVGGFDVTGQWVASGGYYYYQGILPPGGSTLSTPYSLVSADTRVDNSYSGLTGVVRIKADAVQADNFAGALELDGSGRIIGWNDAANELEF